MSWIVEQKVSGPLKDQDKNNKQLETNDHDLAIHTYALWMHELFNRSFSYDSFELYMKDSSNKCYYDFRKLKV